MTDQRILYLEFTVKQYVNRDGNHTGCFLSEKYSEITEKRVITIYLEKK
jgi:hypothetical protein